MTGRGRSAAGLLGWLLGLAAAFAPPGEADGGGDEAAELEALEHFENRVRPLLVQRCFDCHGDLERPKGGLRLDSRAGVLAGGGRGPAVSLEAPGESLLLAAVRRTDPELAMPPREALGAEELADLERWVLDGAPWPANLSLIHI